MLTININKNNILPQLMCLLFQQSMLFSIINENRWKGKLIFLLKDYEGTWIIK